MSNQNILAPQGMDIEQIINISSRKVGSHINAPLSSFTNFAQKLIEEYCRKLYEDILRFRLFGGFENFLKVAKIIKKFKIPEKLFIEALRESLILIRTRDFKLIDYHVLAFKDYESDWEGIVIKFVLKGRYEDLLKIWDELSQKVSQILSEYNKYIYVEVEPDE